MSLRVLRPVRPLLIGVATGAAFVAAGTGSADATAKDHACGNGSRAQQLYPWVSQVRHVSGDKACATIIALGRSVGGGTFPSLESLVTCGPVQTDASGAEVGPGAATLTRTSFRGWTLSYSTDAGLKLAKGRASFHASQQDFGCF